MRKAIFIYISLRRTLALRLRRALAPIASNALFETIFIGCSSLVSNLFISSAESGRVSGQADLHIFFSNVRGQAEARLGADSLDPLVG